MLPILLPEATNVTLGMVESGRFGVGHFFDDHGRRGRFRRVHDEVGRLILNVNLTYIKML